MQKIISFAHSLIQSCSTKTDAIIDATLGNGKDSLMLANSVRKIYAFDIQQIAIENATLLFKNNQIKNVDCILDGHENLDNYVKEMVSGVIFNLGYLPKGEKDICTRYDTTLIAIKKALSLLKFGGVICIVIYPGHNEGLKESVAIKEYVKKLDQKEYMVLEYSFINWTNNPPYLIAIEKL